MGPYSTPSLRVYEVMLLWHVYIHKLDMHTRNPDLNPLEYQSDKDKKSDLCSSEVPNCKSSKNKMVVFPTEWHLFLS
ncbi:hypothetical protein TNCT_566261 [Trichonephila clavata]|uniref:Uncharacterized protein n=1 Tax=Trichonephila clavata TaxID=2740835 RepID=A0A8X6I2I9_TRICU|nr:hypothetical protein TNCT_566261 [Trichonephila clavata]